MYVRRRNMQQNATFCSPEQVYAKDVTLYARIVVTVDPSHRRNEVSSPLARMSTHDYSRTSTFLDFVRTFICFFAVGIIKESVINAETENIFVFSFIIIYSVRRSKQVLFMSVFLTTVR